jgi:hypothetical protein
MLEKKWAMLAKIESSYGTDATPVIGTDLIYTTLPTIEPITRTIERSMPMSNYGAPSMLNIGDGVKITFQVELAADWVASSDTVPSIGTLLRACNFTQTINASTSIVYQNNSSQDGESLTIYFHKDGIRRIILGCRGNVKAACKAGDLVVFDFEFTGKYAEGYSTDQTFPSFTPSLSTACVFTEGEVEIGAYAAPIIEAFNFDAGNVVSKRPSANEAQGILSYFISNAIPVMDVDPEVVALSTYNPFTAWDANSLIDCQTVFKEKGSGTKQCLLEIADLQYGDLKDGSAREGIMTYALNFKAGADADVAFTFTDS